MLQMHECIDVPENLQAAQPLHACNAAKAPSLFLSWILLAVQPVPTSSTVGLHPYC